MSDRLVGLSNKQYSRQAENLVLTRCVCSRVVVLFVVLWLLVLGWIGSRLLDSEPVIGQPLGSERPPQDYDWNRIPRGR